MQNAPSTLTFPIATPPAPGSVTDIAPGIRWLRLPLPYRLDHVNIYLTPRSRTTAAGPRSTPASATTPAGRPGRQRSPAR